MLAGSAQLVLAYLTWYLAGSVPSPLATYKGCNGDACAQHFASAGRSCTLSAACNQSQGMASCDSRTAGRETVGCIGCRVLMHRTATAALHHFVERQFDQPGSSCMLWLVFAIPGSGLGLLHVGSMQPGITRATWFKNCPHLAFAGGWCVDACAFACVPGSNPIRIPTLLCESVCECSPLAAMDNKVYAALDSSCHGEQDCVVSWCWAVQRCSCSANFA